ncbi:MAG: AAA family ATPase [Patescibacteria group bacterium]
MIEKIIKVENVGRFVKLAAKADVQFKRLTLIYGDNGHGKTTLAGILRSLQTGDPAYVQERATLGVNGSPAVEIRLAAGNASFQGGQWSQTMPDLEIFDSTFINENVYTGDRVESEHRKHLYEVVVGAAAVALAHQVDEIDTKSRTAAHDITELETKLRGIIQAPFSVDEFLTLVPENGLEEKISERTTRLSAVRKSREIVARRELDPLTVPEVPAKSIDILQVAVERKTEGGDKLVRQHIQDDLDGRGEQWLRQGLEYLKEDHACPFCTQSTEKVELVALLRDYFSTKYRDHVVLIERAINALDQTLGDDALHGVQKRVLANDGLIRGWADLADLSYATCSTDALEHAWRHVREVLRDALKRRLANPSEPPSKDEHLEAALHDFEEAAAAVRKVNEQIARANEQIADIKKQAAATGEDVLERELRRFRNMQIRQQPEATDLCAKLTAGRQQKKNYEDEKKKTRSQLETIAGSILQKYEQAINRLLQKFGANFTLTGTKPSFQGGRASSTYQISINNTPVNLGDEKTPRGTPCFRTALSSGDKSTLALAFFLARLEQDPLLAQKVIVLDDPLSSLDVFRTACTQQEICRLGSQAKQVVVLSHDADFLKHIYDTNIDKATIKSLQVTRDGATYAIKEWDILKACLEAAYRDFFLLRRYLDEGLSTGGDLLTIARAIRPYLEGQLRGRFPDAFPATDYLGDFIGRIRNAGAGTLLVGLQPRVQELTDINDYSKQFHHNGPGAPPVVNPIELETFVKRTLIYGQLG